MQTNVDLRIGGIAPKVIRELSGIYPTFDSAFRELISNAYDADASQVTVQLSSDFSQVDVEDNGRGMTPFEFQEDYIRIGGSIHSQRDGLTPAGRQPIGRKGIGFLAVARYCKLVQIRTHTNRVARVCSRIELSSELPVGHCAPIYSIEGPLAQSLRPYTTVEALTSEGRPLDPSEYRWEQASLYVLPEAQDRYVGQVLCVKCMVDCSAVDLEAQIDYEYLFGLEEDTNLGELEDFCRITVVPHVDEPECLPQEPRECSGAVTRDGSTQVTLYLRDFVRHELEAPQRPGWVRNISSKSGEDHFAWYLSRNIPVDYELSAKELADCGLDLLSEPVSPLPFVVRLVDSHGHESELRRPLFDAMHGPPSSAPLAKRTVFVESTGLQAQGYLLGLFEPVFPAELRGIAIRVRGVEVGPPSFLGVRDTVPTKYRPFLNQIVGEVVVTEGLDAVSAIMPGREGFYMENPEFQILRRHLVGDGEIQFGLLGEILQELSERSSISSSVSRIVQESERLRSAFLDVSQAVTALSIEPRFGFALRKLFSRTDIEADGLCHTPEYEAGLPTHIQDYRVKVLESGKDFFIDAKRATVQLSRRLQAWGQPLYILGRDFDISLRNGSRSNAVCEIDLSTSTIYFNWMHPTRNKMGDTLFIKHAVYWRIAYLAADGDADLLMDLAHRLLSVSL